MSLPGGLEQGTVRWVHVDCVAIEGAANGT